MTNQEILTKAITLAIAGGWKQVLLKPKMRHWNENGELYYTNDWCVENDVDDTPAIEFVNDIIFNHFFAKSLWGERYESFKVYLNPKKPEVYLIQKSWQGHLQQMVIANDPIKYLGENI